MVTTAACKQQHIPQFQNIVFMLKDKIWGVIRPTDTSEQVN